MRTYQINPSNFLILKFAILAWVLILICFKQSQHHSKLNQKTFSPINASNESILLKSKNCIKIRRSFRKSYNFLCRNENDVKDVLVKTDQSKFLKGHESTETSSKQIEPVSSKKDFKSSSDGNDRRSKKPLDHQSKPKYVRHGSDPVKGIGGWQLFRLNPKKSLKKYTKSPQDLSKDKVGESFQNEFATHKTAKKELNLKKSKKKFSFSFKSKKPGQSNDANKSDASNQSEELFSFESDVSSFMLKTPRHVGDGM